MLCDTACLPNKVIYTSTNCLGSFLEYSKYWLQCCGLQSRLTAQCNVMLSIRCCAMCNFKKQGLCAAETCEILWPSTYQALTIFVASWTIQLVQRASFFNLLVTLRLLNLFQYGIFFRLWSKVAGASVPRQDRLSACNQVEHAEQPTKWCGALLSLLCGSCYLSLMAHLIQESTFVLAQNLPQSHI